MIFDEPPELMVVFLLDKHDQNLEKAIIEARDTFNSYKASLHKKLYWCEVIHRLEHGHF